MFRFVRICMTMEGMKPKKTAQMSIRVDDEFMSRVREFRDENGSLKAMCPSSPTPPMKRSIPPASTMRAS